MRISAEYIEAILKVCANYSNPIGEMYLYGSRTNDSLKGGDIDLLWILPHEDIKSVYLKKHYILADIKKEIGDQKIDLSITCKSEIKTNPFYQQILTTAILLN